MNHGEQPAEKEGELVRRCGWCQLELGVGAAHLSKDVCIKAFQLEYAAVVNVASNLEAQNTSLKMTARIAWVLLNRMDGKLAIIPEAELKLPAGARCKAVPMDDHTIHVEAVVVAAPGKA